MAISTIKATMQMRRGAEENFDPDQMTAGEWAVSLDSKRVWMCFAPGIVRRMATYEAFEQDMEEIRRILATCQDIQEAVEAFEALAEQHKDDAANSAQAADGSATAASISETNAAGSAASASGSAQAAADSASDAKDSQDAAKASEDASAKSATSANESKEAAADSAQAAAGSATSASTSAGEAAVSAGEAEDYSLMSKSYAVGTDGQVRPNDPTDNSKYYSELAQYLTDEAAKLLDQAQKLISAATAGALIPSGTIAFENLPESPKVGYMYNISNAFITDDRFAEGPGIQYNPGANVYWTKDGQWDVMIGVQVTGVKGAAESFYRQGNVNISATDIGLGNVPNVTTNDQTPTFTQAATRENIVSGNKLSVLFGKIMKWYADLKAVAFSGSYNDLSDKPSIPSVGNGTVTIKQAGTQKGTFSMNQSGNTTIELTDNNTTYGAATQSAPGLMSAADKQKLDGVASGANAYSLPLAASGTRGGAQIGYTANGKNYPVQLSGEKMFVNVPWTDTNTWRPVQNNLTSDATDQSLSAAQGKALKGMIDEVNTGLSNGAASTLLGSNLPANRALMTSGGGKVAVSSVTATELGYLAGATSGIQGQLNNLNSKQQTFISWNGLTIGIYHYGRMGSIASISGALTTGLTAYTKYTLGTIASGFRPLNQLTKIILIQGDVQAMLNITRAGVVELTPYAALDRGYVPLIAEMYEIS